MCQAGQLDGGGLRVTFQRPGDRIEHTISLANGTSFVPLLRSEEGQPDDDWPVSPPFQEIDVSNRSPDEAIAYLVGKAGSSHWSMSVTLEASLRIIRIDVACRIQSSPDHMGSRYQCLQSAKVDDDGLGFQTAGVTVRLITEEIDGETADARLTRVAQDAGDRQRVDILAPSSSPHLPQTIRWRYRIALGD